jgi:hypothetical protein
MGSFEEYIKRIHTEMTVSVYMHISHKNVRAELNKILYWKFKPKLSVKLHFTFNTVDTVFV